MLSARLTALAAVLIWISTLVPQTIIAQDAEGLPPGIRSVEVDGQPIDAATTPVTNNPTPEIGGRADLEVPAVELIIGDDGAIRVTAELDDRGRFRATVPEALGNGQYSLSINDLAIGSFIVDSAAQVAEDTSQPRDREPFLDIARVVPYPADFGDFAPGIGFLDGQYFTLQEEAARTAAADGEATAQDTREAQRSLGEAGWLQRYENRLAVPSTDNPETFDVQVSSFVVEYATGDHANAAFVELTGADSGVDFPVVGDESALTRLSGVTPDTGSEYQAARLVFRVGPMLGMIVYADLLNQEPDLALLETVAQTVAGRAAVVADRETVPLGSMALRLDPSTAVDALVRRDIYDVRAGTLTALYAEDDATREGRIELLTGTTDAFSSTTNGTFATGSANRSDRAPRATPRAEPAPSPAPTSVIEIEGEPAESVIVATPQAITPASDGEADEQESVQVFATSALYAFPGESEASAWLTGNQERLAAGAASGNGTLIEVPDGPTLGDESVTFQTRRTVGAGEQTANGFRIYSRVGAIIAALEVSSTGDLPLDDMAKLMALQVDCIEAGGCRGLASLSGRLVEFEVVETAPPVVAESTKVPRQRPAEPTKVPRQRPTEAPVEQEAPAPIVEPPPAPIEEPPPLPVEEPTQVPVEEPTQVPVEEPTVPPVEEPPPVDEGTPPVGEEPTPAPGEEPTPVPGEEPTPPPDVEPTPTAAVEPTPEPVEEPTAVPDEEPTVAPAEEPTVAPAEEPAAEPTVEPASDESGSDRENDGKSDRERARDRLRDRLD